MVTDLACGLETGRAGAYDKYFISVLDALTGLFELGLPILIVREGAISRFENIGR